MESSKSILVVEDDESIRETIQMVLEFEGYHVTTATNGEEGVRVLQQKSAPNLILLDLMMPVMDGWEFLKTFRKHKEFNQIPVVVLSASGIQAKPEGAVDFVQKPLELERLIKVASQFCEASA